MGAGSDCSTDSQGCPSLGTQSRDCPRSSWALESKEEESKEKEKPHTLRNMSLLLGGSQPCRCRALSHSSLWPPTLRALPHIRWGLPGSYSTVSATCTSNDFGVPVGNTSDHWPLSSLLSSSPEVASIYPGWPLELSLPGTVQLRKLQFKESIFLATSFLNLWLIFQPLESREVGNKGSMMSLRPLLLPS